MRRVTGSILVGSYFCVSAAAVALAADNRPASGVGAISYGEKGENAGYFDFSVAHGSTIGTFLYAAEDHDHYPEVVVRLDTIDRVQVTGRSFTIRAKGTLQEDPVMIHASGTDGLEAGEPDTFTIKCYAGRKIVYEAEGEVFLGDIEVGTPQ